MRNWIDIINGLIGETTAPSETRTAPSGNLLSLFEHAKTLREGVAINGDAHMAAFAIAVAEAYDAAPRFDEGAKSLWDALKESNNEVLFKRLKGAGIHVTYTPEDPYDDGSGDATMMVRRMLWDMTVNNHLGIYSGHSDDHPVFSPRDNVIFRTVHDYFTHGKLRRVFSDAAKRLGSGDQPSGQELTKLLPRISLSKGGNVGHAFTLRGELNAFSTHARLAPTKALPALFTEVVGQACYNTMCGDFPQQKVAVLPDFDIKKIGHAKAGSTADRRIQEIMEMIRDGAEMIQTHIRVMPEITTKQALQAVSRQISEGEELDEMAGAGLSRMSSHISSKTPFIQLSGARKGMSQKQIRQRTRDIVQVLKGFGLGPIDTWGGFDEMDPQTGARSSVKEPSLFVPLSKMSKLNGDALLELGTALSQRFEQDAIIFGDGETVFLVDYIGDNIEKIGDYGSIDTHDMPYGWTSIKGSSKKAGQRWAWAGKKEAGASDSPTA